MLGLKMIDVTKLITSSLIGVIVLLTYLAVQSWLLYIAMWLNHDQFNHIHICILAMYNHFYIRELDGSKLINLIICMNDPEQRLYNNSTSLSQL